MTTARNWLTRYAFALAFLNGMFATFGILAHNPYAFSWAVGNGVLVPLWLARRRDECYGCKAISPLANSPTYLCAKCAKCAGWED